MTTYYDILGLQTDATEQEIKKAYRTLSFKYHPDKTSGQEDKFKELNEAYSTLSDKRKKKQYDRTLHQYNDIDINDQINMFENILSGFMGGAGGMKMGSKKNNSGGFHNLFGGGAGAGATGFPMDANILFTTMDMNGDKMPGTNPFVEEEPDDIHLEETISFLDSYNGVTIPIFVEREVQKHKNSIYEKEKLYVKIEPGTDDGEFIIVEGKGNIIKNKQSDIKIKIRVEPCVEFYRKGINLYYKKVITFKDSICGFDFTLEHLNGNKLKFDSSRGNIIQNFDTKVIKGKGFKRNDTVGDLIIEFKVLHPVFKLTEEQLEQFDKVL